MNITAFGNDDRLDVGIALDPAAFAEPDLLVDCLARGLRRVRVRGGRRRARRRRVIRAWPGASAVAVAVGVTVRDCWIR